MSKELRDLAKKVMEKVEEAVDREDEAFKKALGFIREEIKAILGNDGDDSVGEAQSPNPTVAAPIWAHMGGPQPKEATSPNAPTRTLGEEDPDYSDQLPGNGVPELKDGQEPSASIPNAQAPITAEQVQAIENHGAAATNGLGTEMAHVADSDAKPEESATQIEPQDAPKAPESPIVAADAAASSATPDSGEDAASATDSAKTEDESPLPSQTAIEGADAGTAVGEQKEAEAAGSPEAGPLASSASSDGALPSGQPEADSTSGLPLGGNSVESAPLPTGDEDSDSGEDLDDSDSDSDGDGDSDADSDATDSDGAPKKKRGRRKKQS